MVFISWKVGPEIQSHQDTPLFSSVKVGVVWIYGLSENQDNISMAVDFSHQLTTLSMSGSSFLSKLCDLGRSSIEFFYPASGSAG